MQKNRHINCKRSRCMLEQWKGKWKLARNKKWSELSYPLIDSPSLQYFVLLVPFLSDFLLLISIGPRNLIQLFPTIVEKKAEWQRKKEKKSLRQSMIPRILLLRWKNLLFCTLVSYCEYFFNQTPIFLHFLQSFFTFCVFHSQAILTKFNLIKKC